MKSARWKRRQRDIRRAARWLLEAGVRAYMSGYDRRTGKVLVTPDGTPRTASARTVLLLEAGPRFRLALAPGVQDHGGILEMDRTRSWPVDPRLAEPPTKRHKFVDTVVTLDGTPVTPWARESEEPDATDIVPPELCPRCKEGTLAAGRPGFKLCRACAAKVSGAQKSGPHDPGGRQ